MNQFPTPGLDGSNPLGFLAALGLLRVLSLERPRAQAPRMAWMLDGYWYPVFIGAGSLDDAVQSVLADRDTWATDTALALAYDASGAVVDPSADPSATRDLKPPPRTLRAFFEQAIETTADGTPATFARRRRTLDMVASYASDVVQDNNGNTKPTAFHFTAGQQRFLEAVDRLRQGLSEAVVSEALVGPWSGLSTLPSMSWDCTIARNYALRASDPSKEKRGSNPGADWLAFMGLSFTRVASRSQRLLTTGVVGGWKDSSFAWPLWTVPLSACVLPSLLGLAGLRNMPAPERRARGVAVVFSSAITRSDQGGYGGFSPSAVV